MTGWLFVAVLAPFVGTGVVLAGSRRRSAYAGVIATIIAALSLAGVVKALYEHIDHPAGAYVPWLPNLGLSFSLVADGLSLLFAFLITAVGLVVFAYATAYLDETENRRRFFVYLLFFMGSMLGVVTAGNLIALFVFWELTSVSSFLLIGFWHKNERSRDGALKALVVTATGGLAMLVGFVLIGIACDSFELHEILARRQALLDSGLAVPAAILVIAGAMTKSAQVPFHLWLPGAMEAPTPVSAYLHAATMVKAGLYLVARLGPLLAPVALWTPTLTTVGLATMAWGSWMALRQRDLKALLAFSTVSQLGLILALLAPAEPSATAAGLFHVMNHAAFKGALFLLVGVIEHEAHTRDLALLGPLRGKMPVTCSLLVVAALSMAGVPPLGGFVSKEMFLNHVLGLSAPLAVLAIVGAALTAGYCFALVSAVVLGHPRCEREIETCHDPPVVLLWGPAVLVTTALALGPWAQGLASHLVNSASKMATSTTELHVHLSLWHGITPALAVSTIVIAVGVAIAGGWRKHRLPAPPILMMDRLYLAALKGLEGSAKYVTQAYMSGILWRYNAIILGVVIVGLTLTMGQTGWLDHMAWGSRSPRPFEYLVIVAAIMAAVGACLARTRLAAILALGANGYMLAMLFSVLGAPDLALTQVMVETISVALFLAAFVFLPAYGPVFERRLRPMHLLLALTFGTMVPLLVAAARGARVAPSIANYFLDNSVLRAGGHNVVNVILVDFRGLDTMGEITVLAVAALACYAVIRLRGEAGEHE